MAINPNVKQLLLFKLKTWNKFEEKNIIHEVSDQLCIDDSIVVDIAKELVTELQNKAKILEDYTPKNGPQTNRNE